MRKSKKVRLEEKEDKKAKKIPLRKYTKGGKSSTLIAIESLLVIILAIAISVAMKGSRNLRRSFDFVCFYYIYCRVYCRDKQL